MKKLLAILLFISFSFSASAQYIEGQETSTASGEIMTTMMVWNDRDEHGCIGSAWYTWSEEKNECVRPWEEEAQLWCWEAKDENWKVILNEWTWEALMICADVMTTTTEEPKICTMEYAPVCAQVQVQCIMAPCYPVAETFGNSCAAWDNPIIHTGECNSYLDMALYSKYEKLESKLSPKMEKLSLLTLKKWVILVDKMIDQTKLMKMVQWALEKRTTGLIFIKHLFEKEINNRK